MVTGDSEEEVIIFRDRQTDRQTLHHYIFIIIIIIFIAMINTIIIHNLHHHHNCQGGIKNTYIKTDSAFRGVDPTNFMLDLMRPHHRCAIS